MLRVLVLLGYGAESLADGTPSQTARAALGIAANKLTWGFDVCLVGNAAPERRRYATATQARNVYWWPPTDQIEFDAVICGAEHEPWGNLVPATLACQADAALIFGVLDLDWEDGHWRVLRSLGLGAKEVLKVTGRAVFCLDRNAPYRYYVSRHRRHLAARQFPDETITESTTPLVWAMVKPRTSREKLASNQESSANVRLQNAFGLSDPTIRSSLVIDSPDACAQHLYRYLRHYEFISGPPLDFYDSEHNARPARHAINSSPFSRDESPSTKRKTIRSPHPIGDAPAGLYRRPRPRSQLVPSVSLNVAAVRSPRNIGSARPLRRPRRITVAS